MTILFDSLKTIIVGVWWPCMLAGVLGIAWGLFLLFQKREPVPEKNVFLFLLLLFSFMVGWRLAGCLSTRYVAGIIPVVILLGLVLLDRRLPQSLLFHRFRWSQIAGAGAMALLLVGGIKHVGHLAKSKDIIPLVEFLKAEKLQHPERGIIVLNNIGAERIEHYLGDRCYAPKSDFGVMRLADAGEYFSWISREVYIIGVDQSRSIWKNQEEDLRKSTLSHEEIFHEQNLRYSVFLGTLKSRNIPEEKKPGTPVLREDFEHPVHLDTTREIFFSEIGKRGVRFVPPKNFLFVDSLYPNPGHNWAGADLERVELRLTMPGEAETISDSHSLLVKTLSAGALVFRQPLERDIGYFGELVCRGKRGSVFDILFYGLPAAESVVRRVYLPEDGKELNVRWHLPANPSGQATPARLVLLVRHGEIVFDDIVLRKDVSGAPGEMNQLEEKR